MLTIARLSACAIRGSNTRDHPGFRCAQPGLPCELADDLERFGDGVIAATGLDRMLDATVQMMLEQLQRQRIQRRLHRADLRSTSMQ